MKRAALILLISCVALAQDTPVVSELPTADPATAPATPAMTTLDLDWESVKEASGYEVELAPKTGGEPLRFEVQQSSISQQIPINVYKLRIRSKESSSGIYGAWSEATEVDVMPKHIELISPDDNAELATETGNALSVDLRWTPVAGAKSYSLKIWPDGDESKAKEFVTRKTSGRVKLTGMKRYNWSVTFETTSSITYKAEAKSRTFMVKGPKLTKPVIEDIEIPEVTEFNWSDSPGVETYEAILMRRNLDEAEWKPFAERKDSAEPTWEFEKLPAGYYRVEVTAHAKMRTSSESDFIEFIVKPTKDDLIRALRGAVPPQEPRRLTASEKPKHPAER